MHLTDWLIKLSICLVVLIAFIIVAVVIFPEWLRLIAIGISAKIDQGLDKAQLRLFFNLFFLFFVFCVPCSFYFYFQIRVFSVEFLLQLLLSLPLHSLYAILLLQLLLYLMHLWSHPHHIQDLEDKTCVSSVCPPILWSGMVLTLIYIYPVLHKNLYESDFLSFAFEFCKSVGNSRKKRILGAMIPVASYSLKIRVSSSIKQGF